jgi:hypothetical protein
MKFEIVVRLEISATCNQTCLETLVEKNVVSLNTVCLFAAAWENMLHLKISSYMKKLYHIMPSPCLSLSRINQQK